MAKKWNHPSWNEPSIAEQLRSYFKTTFKTQRAAADHFGITQASVSQVVNGKRSPSAAMLEAAGIKA